ncbi:hypothetical protein [Mycoplasmopsis cynos]|uniref:Uncharacterized protein n=1 Tax=Mycoplasmopsis cynos TaxID=171284 RepID=A0A449AHE8_9BACT|nr:hypothetical protein [Mycoplasmopsis cynos]MCU9932458.1 hypothetical protein [Mycoplasmopsis cynos]MCU9933432.1 hypothetical protein [Mycoplasmopsis cynos]WQQ13443.1 hypothetical protein RRG58_01710 [Mycoplasmopsis cynos]WQQ13718.1 hypothetical protein RRG52_03120 [Mycoplasmopsis cynos]WQQ16858.1 hypothetical protein RRG39_03745 [Mycoplasmopsis cynos]
MKKIINKIIEFFKWLKVNSKNAAITLLENTKLDKNDIKRLKKIVDNDVFSNKSV